MWKLLVGLLKSFFFDIRLSRLNIRFFFDYRFLAVTVTVGLRDFSPEHCLNYLFCYKVLSAYM